ncbi:MAG TPA: M20/M25/M40 family metallo-hydrolase [Polyangiaceae bacterium]|nr:M20/M25/M40 family metallo-hydrolase [Polyangiaceae bacterium]
MKIRGALGLLGVVALLSACGGNVPAPQPKVQGRSNLHNELITSEEKHFADLTQLTYGGENAEAYWSFDGSQLIFQAHATDAAGASGHGGEGCDQIYRMPLTEPPTAPILVSTGKGATTCSYFLPGDQQIIYASTHLGGAACPPKPDHSQGYVWALYPSYDIFRANADGSNPVQLTDVPGYDAEATVCSKDGSIVFTSVRDGDIDLYRMDADGRNVKRLTNTPGYDGGAFFNQDCSKIVWRASRPEGKDLEDFRNLLSQNLVRPTKLELYVANADGTEPTQITYLNAASFAPYWHPSGKRIVFASNYGDPQGREFDIWAVNVDGTDLERITYAPGFDGFPMFSPDGKTLAFSSNRATAKGAHDTNVFLAHWQEPSRLPVAATAADRIASDIRWLADPAREGRGLGTAGLAAAGAFIEERFKMLGLQPVGNSYRQAFDVETKATVAAGTQLKVGKQDLKAGDFQPLVFSAQRSVSGSLVLAGFGIVDADLGVDDYKGLNVKGKIVVVRRFVPDDEKFQNPKLQNRFGDLRYKAFIAHEHGALGMIVVDAPLPPKDVKDWQPPSEARFPSLMRDAYGDAGIVSVIAKREAFAPVLAELSQRHAVRANLSVALTFEKQPAFNVVARLPANAPANQVLPGAIVIGAHYDHLGMGGSYSRAPDVTAPHPGADDNASGVASVLEIARTLSEAKDRARDVIFMGFSAEESGVLGSSHLVHEPPAGLDIKQIYAMLNLDMVGRLRDNKLTVLGVKTASEWESVVSPLCKEARVQCSLGGDGYGPSDQTSFYSAGIPVLFFFTGTHDDYHKPSDTADRINAVGASQVASIVTGVTGKLEQMSAKLSYQKVIADNPQGGDVRSFNASLGTIPDYAGPKSGKGVLLSGVRPGSAADKAGMLRDDVLLRIGKTDINDVHDLMYVLNSSKPGQTVMIEVLRGGIQVKLSATFEERPAKH